MNIEVPKKISDLYPRPPKMIAEYIRYKAFDLDSESDRKELEEIMTSAMNANAEDKEWIAVYKEQIVQLKKNDCEKCCVILEWGKWKEEKHEKTSD